MFFCLELTNIWEIFFEKKKFLKKGSVSVFISSDSIANNFSTEIDTKIVLRREESPWKAEEKLVSGFSKFEF